MAAGPHASAAQDFERGDSRSRAQAAINLSTLHMLEGDTEAAAEYAEFCLGVSLSSSSWTAAPPLPSPDLMKHAVHEDVMPPGWLAPDHRAAPTNHLALDGPLPGPLDSCNAGASTPAGLVGVALHDA